MEAWSAGVVAAYRGSDRPAVIGGLGNTLAALSAGAGVVATASFSADWWRGLAAHGVTHALLVPSMIEMLLAEDALDQVELRTLIYGASPIRPETLALVLDTMPAPADRAARVLPRPPMTAGRSEPR
jgi:acyl-CoA synthetase (AMP-forming)/AMP-acid ligase II